MPGAARYETEHMHQGACHRRINRIVKRRLDQTTIRVAYHEPCALQCLQVVIYNVERITPMMHVHYDAMCDTLILNHILSLSNMLRRYLLYELIL